jgi:peptidoglycan/LPS O-acetylase OafA/YrhL
MHSHRTRLPYLPALDGLRAVAVAAVLLFHADLPWMEGRHLGVTVFFTLSGFLITGLLLAEHHETGTLDLKAFWARRARRPVPAMFACFGLVAAALAPGRPERPCVVR